MTRKGDRFVPLTHNIPSGSLSPLLVTHWFHMSTHCGQGHEFIFLKYILSASTLILTWQSSITDTPVALRVSV